MNTTHRKKYDNNKETIRNQRKSNNTSNPNKRGGHKHVLV